jgi:cardiolipin synthase
MVICDGGGGGGGRRLSLLLLTARLSSAGVRIFELTKQSLHAKIITVDGVYCSVGSYNLDYLSTYRNLEVTLAALDRSLVNQLDQHFDVDCRNSQEVMLTTLSARPWYERLLHASAYQVARVFKFLNF